MPSPPRFALALLRRRLPAADFESVAGDLTEVFAARVEARRRFTRVWFWTQTLLFVCLGGFDASSERSRGPNWRPAIRRTFSLRPALRLFRQDPGTRSHSSSRSASASARQPRSSRPSKACSFGPCPTRTPIASSTSSRLPSGTAARRCSRSSMWRTIARKRRRSTSSSSTATGSSPWSVPASPSWSTAASSPSNYFKVLAIRPLLGRTLGPRTIEARARRRSRC